LNLNLNLNCARANEIAYLKFPVCGRSTQASIHMHVRNEVTLVWGLLRLAPIRDRALVQRDTEYY